MVGGIFGGLTFYTFSNDDVVCAATEQPQATNDTEKALVQSAPAVFQVTEKAPPEEKPIPGFSKHAAEILKIAYDRGNEFGYPETIQAIALKETLAGTYFQRIGDTNLPVGKRSYGVMQVKVATVRYVFKHFPKLRFKYFGKVKKIPAEEIISLMLNNDPANISVAAKYFQLLTEKTKNWSAAVVAYNQGLGGLQNIDNPENFAYTQKISKLIHHRVRPFNKLAGL